MTATEILMIIRIVAIVIKVLKKEDVEDVVSDVVSELPIKQKQQVTELMSSVEPEDVDAIKTILETIAGLFKHEDN